MPTSPLLAGKTALVTGASSGIGRAIALRLAAEGAFVWIHYNRTPGGAEDALAAARKGGGDGALLKGDVGSVDEIRGRIFAPSVPFPRSRAARCRPIIAPPRGA